MNIHSPSPPIKYNPQPFPRLLWFGNSCCCGGFAVSSRSRFPPPLLPWEALVIVLWLGGVMEWDGFWEEKPQLVHCQSFWAQGDTREPVHAVSPHSVVECTVFCINLLDKQYRKQSRKHFWRVFLKMWCCILSLEPTPIVYSLSMYSSWSLEPSLLTAYKRKNVPFVTLNFSHSSFSSYHLHSFYIIANLLHYLHRYSSQIRSYNSSSTANCYFNHSPFRLTDRCVSVQRAK